MPEKITNPNCTINILHMERSGEQLDCLRCEMECEFKTAITEKSKTAQD